ncbi:hypothetical protein Pmani_013339 [Petrolisthes manimaculis]|uniref:Uncharacterized protein n=1 Tax=Petrolisthes manimaculis TaxID=1843537 RepID=A0AAE1U9P0_9EUCA|nr:hypothetical protein Pmani_013339 [Petrolisthes manimaculis]
MLNFSSIGALLSEKIHLAELCKYAHELKAKLFYSKNNTATVIPSQYYVGNDEDLSDDDDDVADLDFSPPCLSDMSGPSPKKICTLSAVEVMDDETMMI